MTDSSFGLREVGQTIWQGCLHGTPFDLGLTLKTYFLLTIKTPCYAKRQD